MRKKHCRQFLLTFICFLLVFGVFPISAEETDYGGAANDILEKQMQQAGVASLDKFSDGWMAEHAAGVADWIMMALYHGKETFSTARYGGKLYRQMMEQGANVPAATRQRYALALRAANINVPAVYSSIADETILEDQLMTVIFGIHLLQNGCESERWTVEQLKDVLLAEQLEDGGWALSGDVADVDVTAMALGALAHFPDDIHVSECCGRAIDCLSAKQLADGGFESWGTKNAESCAQVIIGLTAWGVDVTTDARFIKNGNSIPNVLLSYRLTDGGYSHIYGGEANSMATAQAFCAFTVLDEAKEQSAVQLYAFSCKGEVEPIFPDKETEIKHEEWGKTEIRLLCSGALLLIGIAVAVVLLKMKKGEKDRWITLVALMGAMLYFIWGTEWIVGLFCVKKTEGNFAGQVSITVSCEDILSKGEKLPSGIAEDGIILHSTQINLYEGQTVFDILQKALEASDVDMTASGAAMGSPYIREIAGIAEFDYGGKSGWVYTVNGEYPSVSCGAYVLHDKDEIVFSYSIDAVRPFN